jgi:hypothetical protein
VTDVNRIETVERIARALMIEARLYKYACKILATCIAEKEGTADEMVELAGRRYCYRRDLRPGEEFGF